MTLWTMDSALVKIRTSCRRSVTGLGPGAVKNFFWRWLDRLPSPFTPADMRAGYVYDLAFRQFEVSDTRVFERPQAGRMWFEGVIRDHLDIGRPHQIALVFNRLVTRTTPGTFRTRVLTKGVDPTLCCYFKSSRLKQYFKEGKALRTETVICDTKDFGIGRRRCSKNWSALKEVGQSANRRLCDAEAADAQPAPDDVVVGFRNTEMVERIEALLEETPYTSRQATYDLRRLKRKGPRPQGSRPLHENLRTCSGTWTDCARPAST